MKKTLLFFVLAAIIVVGCNQPAEKETANEQDSFTVAFLTDIHVQPEKNAIEGFNKAIAKVNELKPDLVITGGDLVMDVLGTGYDRADSLYNIYDSLQAKFEMPVYNTLGNHEVFGLYKESGIDTIHPLYGKKLYEERVGPRYQSFDHKGWHFMILDGIGYTPERRYIGYIDEEQMNWIKEDLAGVNKDTPIAISVHIPFINAGIQYYYGSLEENGPGAVITNAKEVLELFNDHNLKLALQGHLHWLEDIYIDNTHFIIGGAVSSNWWSGKRHGMEEGFLLLDFTADNFDWEYIDYGWEVAEKAEE